MCREYVQEPLYLLVARWAMQQQRWISSREIADKFNLTPCKAINLVSYILSAVDEIDCQTKTIPNHLEGRGCQCQRMIQVDHIDDQITERIKNAINTDGDDNDSTSMPRMTIPVPPSELNQEQKWKWMLSKGQ
ncbi:MAG: carnitine metabolism transcriptional regulator CaiF, partial [Hafnia sp.]